MFHWASPALWFGALAREGRAMFLVGWQGPRKQFRAWGQTAFHSTAYITLTSLPCLTFLQSSLHLLNLSIHYCLLVAHPPFAPTGQRLSPSCSGHHPQVLSHANPCCRRGEPRASGMVRVPGSQRNRWTPQGSRRSSVLCTRLRSLAQKMSSSVAGKEDAGVEGEICGEAGSVFMLFTFIYYLPPSVWPGDWMEHVGGRITCEPEAGEGSLSKTGGCRLSNIFDFLRAMSKLASDVPVYIGLCSEDETEVETSCSQLFSPQQIGSSFQSIKKSNYWLELHMGLDLRPYWWCHLFTF